MSEAGRKAASEALGAIVDILARVDFEYRPWVLAWALGFEMQDRGARKTYKHFLFGLEGCLRVEGGKMKTKSLVGKIKGARKFVKAEDLPRGGGVGKAVTPVSSGGKKKKK